MAGSGADRETFESDNGCIEADRPSDNVEKEAPSKTYLDNSTLHGLHFVRALEGARRIVWIILMLACTFFLIEAIVKASTNFLEFESVISRSTRTQKKSTLKFPVVTICNRNMLVKSRINGTYSQVFLDTLDPSKQQELDGTNITDPIDYLYLMKYAHNISDMLVKCTWKDRKCGPNEFKPVMVSDIQFGLCYSFNTGYEGREVLESSKPSPQSGLALTLNPQPEEYYGPFSEDGTGFRITVHEQNQSVQMQQYGIDVSPGFRTEIAFKKVITERLASPYPSMCVNKRIKFFESDIDMPYTVSSCYENCYLRQIRAQCKCLASHVFRSGEKQRICSPKDYRDCILPLHDGLDRWKCKCSLPCEQIDYRVQMSSSYYPSEHAWPQIMRSHGFNATNASYVSGERFKSNYRKKRARVILFYRSLTTDVVREKILYDVHALLSTVGGNMGFYLGCSVLTLYEMLDFLCTCFFQFVKRRSFNRVHKVNHNQPSP